MRYIKSLCTVSLLLIAACAESTSIEEDADTASLVDARTPDSTVDGNPVNLRCEGLPTISPGTTTRTILVDGLERSFDLTLPDDYNPESKARLVFGWHGLGGNGALLRSYSSVQEASVQSPAKSASIFVFPDGLYVASLGQTAWQESDTEFYDAMLSELNQELCIDESRIFSFGHSFGGYFSNMLGCLRGESVRAIGSVSGGWPLGLEGCSSAIPAWLAHATNDPIVSVLQGRESRDVWLSQNSCGSDSSAVEPSPCVAYTDCQSDAVVHWCETPLSGHVWPLFAGSGLWDFFVSFDSTLSAPQQ